MASDTDLDEENPEAALFAALSTLEDADEASRFLKDLATPAEIAALAERWRIARLLDAGGRSYREIARETGASTTTVVRVARFLGQEPHQGYRRMLDRIKRRAAAEEDGDVNA